MKAEATIRREAAGNARGMLRKRGLALGKFADGAEYYALDGKAWRINPCGSVEIVGCYFEFAAMISKSAA